MAKASNSCRASVVGKKKTQHLNIVRLAFKGDVINNKKGDQKHEESLLVISHARYN